MVPAMRQARVKWLVSAIAVLLNVVGSPMAWAQWLEAESAHTNASSMDAEGAPCHGHDAAAGEQSAPESMPCCDGGGCTCAAPALFVYPAQTTAREVHPTFIAPGDTSTLPAHPFDDTLRPPIR
jgi:hypothetical protein